MAQQFVSPKSEPELRTLQDQLYSASKACHDCIHSTLTGLSVFSKKVQTRVLGYRDRLR